MNDSPIEGITSTQEAQAEAFARLVKRVEQLETLEVGGAADYILIQDQKAAGVDGGTFTAGAWRTRDLNTIVHNEGSHAALAANQITLQAGTYRVFASAPAHMANNHQLRFYNVTDAIAYLGPSGWAIQTAITSSYGVEDRAFVADKFTIASAKVFELQHRSVFTKATDGFGVGINVTWGINIYAMVELWKVG